MAWGLHVRINYAWLLLKTILLHCLRTAIEDGIFCVAVSVSVR